jgi:hypothetical protein
VEKAEQKKIKLGLTLLSYKKQHGKKVKSVEEFDMSFVN